MRIISRLEDTSTGSIRNKQTAAAWETVARTPTCVRSIGVPRREKTEEGWAKGLKKQLKKFKLDKNCKTTDPSSSKDPEYEKRKGNDGKEYRNRAAQSRRRGVNSWRSRDALPRSSSQTALNPGRYVKGGARSALV